eukprot:jgi/Ulvmu1/1387/UM011_0115.1
MSVVPLPSALCLPQGARGSRGTCARLCCHFSQRAPANSSITDVASSHVIDAKRSVQCHGLLADRPSSNPALRFGQFQRTRRSRNDSWGDESRQDLMTMQGTIGKTAILLLITLCGAGYVWQQTAMQLAAATTTAAIVSLKGGLTQIATVSGIGGMVVGLATAFKPNWAPWSAPLYAALKGAVLGALSIQFEAMFPGVVMSAVLITMGTAGGMLGAYSSGMIVVTDRLRSIITTSVVGVMLAYLGSMLLGLFGVKMAFLSTGTVGLVVGGFTAMVAASCLLLDFDSIRQMQYAGFPKYMEWYGGFSILVTLVWLYTEVLRFLSILNSSRDD